MEPSITSALLVYGPLGAIALICLGIAVRLYRDLQSERAAHRQSLTEWQERHVAAAEKWMERYHELGNSLNETLESIARQFEHRGRGGDRPPRLGGKGG